MSKPNILLLDLETAPKIAYVWQFWKEHVHPDKVIQDGYIMSVAWKWLGTNQVDYTSCRRNIGNDYELVHLIRQLLNSADIVVAHNARKFDIPTFNKGCMLHGIAPPSPYRIVDTLEVARKKFKFDNNSLGYLCHLLGIGEKGQHKKFPGFTLWKECMAGNQEAWEEMIDYNILDVSLLEQVYLRLRPWMDNHPNVGVYMQKDHPVCPKCGSLHLQSRGTYKTTVCTYSRYQCVDCGGWAKSRKAGGEKHIRQSLIANAGVV